MKDAERNVAIRSLSLPLAAFLLATAGVLYAYAPLFMPLLNHNLTFAQGDFTSIVGADSGAARITSISETFQNGWSNVDHTRAFLLLGISSVTGALGVTDAMLDSLLILIMIILGSSGMYLLIRLLGRDCEDGYCMALLVLSSIPFYFLNQWSIERITHLWIWLAYAILPLFLYLGLHYLGTGRRVHLLAYTLVLGVFGVFPDPAMYFFAFHALLVAWSVRKDGLRRTAVFALLPAAAYAILNLPVFLMLAMVPTTYPQSTSVGMLQVLSAYGDFIRIFTFSNTWRPQLQPEIISSNLAFCISSAGFIASALLFYILSRRSLDLSERALMALCMLAIAVVVFECQGTGSPIIQWMVDALGKAGLGILVAPFREWGRLAITIPLLLTAIWAACVPKLEDLGRRAGGVLLLALLAVNLFSSPAPLYLGKIYSPVVIPADYGIVAAAIAPAHKTLWVYPEDAAMVLNAQRYVWNPGKASGPILSGMGDSYVASLTDDMATHGAPKSLLDALNIGYVVKREDILGGTSFSARYDWLDCRNLTYFQVCVNDNASMFRAYDGTIVAPYGSEEFNLLLRLPPGRYAPATWPPDGSARFVLRNPRGEGLNVSPEVYPMYLLKASGGNAGNDSWLLFSNGSALWRDIVADEGDYQVAVLSSGDYNLSLGGKNFTMHGDGMDFSYAGPVHLGNGTARLGIDAPHAKVDTVLIYPAAAGSLSGTPAAEVTGFNRSSETRADVAVNATGPFVLSFAETYDPQWKASVYKDGELTETVTPVPLYGMINGYWIETTGQVDIELKYAPQDVFEAGRAVSLLALSACLAAMIYLIVRPEKGKNMAARAASEPARQGASLSWLLPAIPIVISHFLFADAYIASLLLCAALVPLYACLRFDAADMIKYSFAMLLLALAALPLYGDNAADFFAAYAFFLLISGGAALVIGVLLPAPRSRR